MRSYLRRVLGWVRTRGRRTEPRYGPYHYDPKTMAWPPCEYIAEADEKDYDETVYMEREEANRI